MRRQIIWATLAIPAMGGPVRGTEADSKLALFEPRDNNSLPEAP